VELAATFLSNCSVNDNTFCWLSLNCLSHTQVLVIMLIMKMIITMMTTMMQLLLLLSILVEITNINSKSSKTSTASFYWQLSPLRYLKSTPHALLQAKRIPLS